MSLFFVCMFLALYYAVMSYLDIPPKHNEFD